MPYKDKEKQKEYKRKWIASRRAKWFADKYCVDCKSSEKLELDHIDPKQKVTHRIWSWSWERIEEEVSKCEVRCNSCHVKKTWTKDRQRASHGTPSMYSNSKCRCDECKAAQARYAREYRSRQKSGN